MNWIKENWFKLFIAVVILFVVKGLFVFVLTLEKKEYVECLKYSQEHPSIYLYCGVVFQRQNLFKEL